MAVITVSRQLGSLGCDIANSVAQRLGYRMVWRKLINQAARQARTPEMALEMLDELGLLGLRPSLSTAKDPLSSDVIISALKGCILRTENPLALGGIPCKLLITPLPAQDMGGLPSMGMVLISCWKGINVISPVIPWGLRVTVTILGTAPILLSEITWQKE